MALNTCCELTRNRHFKVLYIIITVISYSEDQTELFFSLFWQMINSEAQRSCKICSSEQQVGGGKRELNPISIALVSLPLASGDSASYWLKPDASTANYGLQSSLGMWLHNARDDHLGSRGLLLQISSWGGGSIFTLGSLGLCVSFLGMLSQLTRNLMVYKSRKLPMQSLETRSLWADPAPSKGCKREPYFASPSFWWLRVLLCSCLHHLCLCLYIAFSFLGFSSMWLLKGQVSLDSGLRSQLEILNLITFTKIIFRNEALDFRKFPRSWRPSFPGGCS